jgi:hypothetical protein
VPFLRLTRDRRGFEHTFLLHADAPGQPPRVLYWYRTAPGVLIGRPALDEEAIRSIEEQHPHIEFDWPAILALREAMPPEEEAGPSRPPRGRRPQRRDQPPAPRALAGAPRVEEPERESRDEPSDEPVDQAAEVVVRDDRTPTTRGLLDELVGRDIATRLRGRYAEMMARIHEQGFDESTLAGWVARAEPLDPEGWLTPDAVLEGVRDADARFEALRSALLSGR